MDIETYALVKRHLKTIANENSASIKDQIQTIAKNAGITDIHAEGNTITITTGAGVTTTVEIPSPDITIDDETGNWFINGVDTGVKANTQMRLYEF